MKYINLLSGSHRVSGWSWRVEPHGHKGYTLWYVSDGSGKLKYGDIDCSISAGDVFLFDYGCPLDATQDEDNPVSIIFADFCTDEYNLPDGLPCHGFSSDKSILKILLERILEYYQSGDLNAVGIFLDAAIEEYRRVVREGNITQSKRIIAQVCENMRSNLSGGLNISETAAEYGYTPDHFIRLFFRETGKTPYDYYMTVRVNTAKSLLLTSNMEIKEIAVNCGFEDIYAFSHFFKRRAGVSPKKYRIMQTADK